MIFMKNSGLTAGRGEPIAPYHVPFTPIVHNDA